MSARLKDVELTGGEGVLFFLLVFCATLGAGQILFGALDWLSSLGGCP